MSEKEKLNMALDDVIKLSKNFGKKGPVNRRGSLKGPLRNPRQNQRKPRFFQGGSNRGGQRPNAPQGQNNFRRRNFPNRQNKPSFKQEPNFVQKQIKKTFIKKTGKNKSIERKMSNEEVQNLPNKKTILRISGLHLNILNTELYDLFSQFGPMKKCRIDYDQLGRSYGTALVQYEKHEHADKAINDYDGAELDGHKLHVEYLDSKINTNTNTRNEILIPQIRRRSGFKQRGGFNRRIRK